MSKVTKLIIVGTLVLFSVLAVVVWYFNFSNFSQQPTVTDALPATSTFSLERSLPTSIYIPKLNLSASFATSVGLLPTGEISAPENPKAVAYYRHARTPGEIGPAIVLGHTIAQNGSAGVFSSLSRISKGDTIEIAREDGTVATFAVVKLDRGVQAEFPTAEVYGSFGYAGLRLITCTQQSFSEGAGCVHDLIVYGQLIATSTVTSAE